MVALKDIRSIADLKGKFVGISSRGGAIDLLTQLMVQKKWLGAEQRCHQPGHRRPGGHRLGRCAPDGSLRRY